MQRLKEPRLKGEAEGRGRQDQRGESAGRDREEQGRDREN